MAVTMAEDDYDDAQDYDPVYDRLDESMYGGEPQEPNCWDCWDGTRLRRRDGRCPTCWPTPRHVRRAVHHEWQYQDRLSRDPQRQQLIRKLGLDEAPF